ncbi:MAG: hypothetical protein IJ075_05210 [Lachnospiraceae bacterium]|nr:hypothetical protein [Lachnospiraceae bacterium]
MISFILCIVILVCGYLFYGKVVDNILSPDERETWKQIKASLKSAGLKGFKAGHYFQETVMGCGCGAKLDPRDFGGNGRVDHDIYWVKVIEGDEDKALEILRQDGIVAGVDKNVLLDAALRKSPTDKYYPRST